MSFHHTFVVALIALPFALACGSPHEEGSDALADGPSRAVSDPETPETPLALLEAYSPKDADALSQRLVQMRVDVAGLRVLGDDIIAEGDMVFSAAHLLRDSEQTIEKGYRSNVTSSGTVVPLISNQNLQNIKLAFDTTLISHWLRAAGDAATAWSSTGIVNISEFNSGDRVTFSFASLGCGSTPASCPLAATTLPRNGHPGATIKVNTDAPAATISEGQRAMLHEMGHALGFMHPAEGSHIGGTAAVAFGVYATVMQPSIGDVAASLTSDDLLSLQRIYAPTSEAEHCIALGLVLCVNTGNCESPIDLRTLGCND